MFGYIYLTTNTVNNKIYIGQHKAEQFEPENYIGSGTILFNAIQKYGKESFKNELLCECASQEELNAKEEYFIRTYNSTDKNIGYNIKYGGNQTPCPEYIKRKISWANSGKYVGHIHITKDGIEKHIDVQDLSSFLAEGWQIGRAESTKKSLSENYNYSSKGMLGKHQSDYQKQRCREVHAHPISEEARAHFSTGKKVPNKFICLRTPDNKSTIRCLKENENKYLNLGYIPCNKQS